ncbi:hypothetical protein [Xanthomonas sp. NCPPB 2632]|uniref:hypothetical protein n=1 Tax=Xanthomonas sp. NCPPB 2632 TaxID=3240912 RepID=UPI003518EC5D
MCYSAQIASDFRTYQRLGGDLDLDAYIQMAGWSKKQGTWTQRVPKGLRNAFLDSTDPAEQDAKAAALDAYQAAALTLEEELAAQRARLVKAKAVLAALSRTRRRRTISGWPPRRSLRQRPSWSRSTTMPWATATTASDRAASPRC